MIHALDNKLEIFSPLEQATRCLDIWLKEEGRILTDLHRQRAAALIARYFHHEDDLSDTLILSFLRHYAGRGEVDMEDPASVRHEIKTVLDRAKEREKEPTWKKVLLGLLVVLAFLGLWETAHRKISKPQQLALKELVHEIDARDKNATSAAIWSDVKSPLGVKSYQDIPWWRYHQSRKMLEQRLGSLP